MHRKVSFTLLKQSYKNTETTSEERKEWQSFCGQSCLWQPRGCNSPRRARSTEDANCHPRVLWPNAVAPQGSPSQWLSTVRILSLRILVQFSTHLMDNSPLASMRSSQNYTEVWSSPPTNPSSFLFSFTGSRPRPSLVAVYTLSPSLSLTFTSISLPPPINSTLLQAQPTKWSSHST